MKIIALFVMAFFSVALAGGQAQALPVKPVQIAKQGSNIKVDVRARCRCTRSRSTASRHLCAYNCYSVPPCFNRTYGRYGYSRFAYDEDIPFRYSYDRDASPIDNAGAAVYPLIGEPFMRIPERVY